MGNLKHTIAALAAVSLVGSLAAVQIREISAVRANKITQEIETVTVAPAVLPGDGEGETTDFTISAPALQIMVGKDAYISTSGGSINLRAAADIESTILDVLSLGDQVKIIDIDEDWFKVESGEYTGYVKSEFVSLDYNKVKAAMLASTMYQRAKVLQGVNVRSDVTETAVILAQIGEGSDVVVLEEAGNGYLKIYYGTDYDIGYIPAETAQIGDMVSRIEINSARNNRLAKIVKDAKMNTAAEVKVMPDANSETITSLSKGAACKIVSGGTNWTKIIISATNEIGYVRTSEVSQIVKEVKKEETKAETKKSAKSGDSAPAVASKSGSALVNQAAKYIGTKYVYGGTSPSGFDCSGLVQYCCKKLGVSVNRSSRAQYSNGVAVSRANLQPGDLVFFSRGGGISHVAIYAGGGQVIHSPRTGRTVCYQSLESICSYSKYVGARRVM